MVKIYTSYFKDNEKLGDSSNFFAWKISLEVILDDIDVLEYVKGKVPEPLANASTSIKYRYKKGDLKTNNIIIDGLRYHLIVYVGNMKEFKYMYHKLVGMHDVNKLNHILSLKDQFKEINMNKGEYVQSYIMRVSHLRDKLQVEAEQVSNMELVLVTLRGLPLVSETLITTLSNNNVFLTFDELVCKCTQEGTRMIDRGRIKK